MTIVCSICALATHYGWSIHQLGIKIAFFNGTLYEKVYLSQPHEFVQKGQENKACRLHKTLYGLKQAGRIL